MKGRGFFTTDVGRISFLKTGKYGQDGKHYATFSLSKADSVKEGNTYNKYYTNVQACIFGLTQKQVDTIKDGTIIHYKGKLASNEKDGKKYYSINIEDYKLINIGGLSKNQASETEVDYPADDQPNILI